jgi:hypothetical protein
MLYDVATPDCPVSISRARNPGIFESGNRASCRASAQRCPGGNVLSMSDLMFRALRFVRKGAAALM